MRLPGFGRASHDNTADHADLTYLCQKAYAAGVEDASMYYSHHIESIHRCDGVLAAMACAGTFVLTTLYHRTRRGGTKHTSSDGSTEREAGLRAPVGGVQRASSATCSATASAAPYASCEMTKTQAHTSGVGSGVASQTKPSRGLALCATALSFLFRSVPRCVRAVRR